VITHVVLFQPRRDITLAEKQELAEAVRFACTQAPTVQKFEIGRVVDVGAGYAQKVGGPTYEYVAIIEFSDRAGLLSYLNHDAHRRLGELFWKACEATAIIDAETMGENI
jgi:hypothetical protein